MNRLEEHVPNVAIMVDHPAQYFSPAFRSLSKLGKVRETVYYWNSMKEGKFDPGFGRHVRWDVDLLSGYRWWAPDSSASLSRKLLRLFFRLRRDNPEAILCFGWGRPASIVGLIYSTLNGIPFILYGDTNSRQTSKGFRRRLRGPFLRYLLRRAAGALSTGVANSEFYISHGLKPEKLHCGVLPIALESFVKAGMDRTARCQDPANSKRFIIGFAGKLLPHKGADELIRAVSLLSNSGNWQLRIVGDGPSRKELEDMVSNLSLQDNVDFLGFKNSNEIPSCLAGMDVFAMPSRIEPRGLVAIEAMAAGAVPVVSSATGVWGEGDAVQDGITGYVYPTGRPEMLASLLLRLMEERELRTQMSSLARARAAKFSPAEFASTTTAALLNVAASKRGPRSVGQ